MASRYLILNSKESPVEVLNHLPEDLSSVIFTVRSECENEAQEIASAIQDVHDILIMGWRDPNTAQTGNIIRSNSDLIINNVNTNTQYYVYVYTDSIELINPDNVFYIGKGRSDRFSQHIKDAIKFDDPTQADLLQRGKILKIRNYIYKNGELTTKLAFKRGLDLVSNVVLYQGNNKFLNEKKALATERFLIHYWIGTFKLCNKNKGNTENKDTVWQTRPNIASVATSIDWKRIVKNSEETQQCIRNITAMAMNEEVSFRGITVQHTDSHRNVFRLEPNKGVFESNGTDVHMLHTISVEKNNIITALLTLQLKMGEQDLGARINLRPLDYLANILENFSNIITKSFSKSGYSPSDFIKNGKRSDAYYKPFAPNGRGNKDVVFDIRNINYSTKIINVPWLGGGDISLNLNDAFKQILQVIGGSLGSE